MFKIYIFLLTQCVIMNPSLQLYCIHKMWFFFPFMKCLLAIWQGCLLFLETCLSKLMWNCAYTAQRHSRKERKIYIFTLFNLKFYHTSIIKAAFRNLGTSNLQPGTGHAACSIFCLQHPTKKGVSIQVYLFISTKYCLKKVKLDSFLFNLTWR